MDQYQQPAPSGGNPYEFILNPQQPKKRGRLRGIGGNNFIRTIIFIVGGAILFMILLSFLLNALAPKKISNEEFIGLAQTQNELIRISTQGVTDSVHQTTKNLATTIEYTLMTQQKQTLEQLAKNGVEPSTEQLALKQNADTDQRFTSAKSTSTFDVTFTQIVEDELNSYAANLKRLSSLAATQADRDRIGDYYQQTQLLISQIPFTQDKLESVGAGQ